MEYETEMAKGILPGAVPFWVSPKYFYKKVNTGLVSNGTSLTSWAEDASLALVGDLSGDGVTIKKPYGVDVLHLPASHPIFSCWVR